MPGLFTLEQMYSKSLTGDWPVETDPPTELISEPTFYDVDVGGVAVGLISENFNTALTTENIPRSSYFLRNFTVTNSSNAEAFFNCNILYPDNTQIVYANNYLIPAGFSVDIINKPEILISNTSIRVQGLTDTKVPYSNILSFYSNYKYLPTVEYSSNSLVISTSNVFHTILDTRIGNATIESIKLVNTQGKDIRATLLWTDANNVIKTYLASNILLAKNFYTEILNNNLRLVRGDKLRLCYYNAPNNAINSFVSLRKSESYAVVSNVETAIEGDIVNFGIYTEYIPDDAIFYYRTTGNLISSDFVGGNVGSFSIRDNFGSVNLALSQELVSEVEGEKFSLEILKDSSAGEFLVGSNFVFIKSIGYASSVVPSSVYMGENANITISLFNANTEQAATLYYTVTGNADLYGNNFGSFTANYNQANIVVITENNFPFTESRQFALQIRRDSINGTIIGTTGNITVEPYPQLVFIATGGNDTYDIEM